MGMDIIHVEVRPHEYSNGQRDSLSVFRIDFAATIRDPDGKEHLILIEIQKTWLETETLRFRQYLGVHYQNPKNVVIQGHETHALRMIAIYLLGHRVGDIEEPVLYVRHTSYDYNDRPVTKGLPNPFIDSLTHDSIIVQVPLLHGQINNRLDKVLSVFDQTCKDKIDQHVLNLDDTLYKDDADMQLILHRLLMAATNAEMRQDMLVEDNYFAAIEHRDTEILARDRQIAEQKVQLQQQQGQLEQQQGQLEQLRGQLEQQNKRLQASVRLFLQAGMPVEEIASNLSMSVQEIQQLAE